MEFVQTALTLSRCRFWRTTTGTGLTRAGNQWRLWGSWWVTRKLWPRSQVWHVHRMTTMPGWWSCHKLIARWCRQTGTIGPWTFGYFPWTASAVIRTLRNSPLTTLVYVELVFHNWHHKSHVFVDFLVYSCTRYNQNLIVLWISITSLYTNTSSPSTERHCYVYRIQVDPLKIDNFLFSSRYRLANFTIDSCLFVCVVSMSNFPFEVNLLLRIPTHNNWFSNKLFTVFPRF